MLRPATYLLATGLVLIAACTRLLVVVIGAGLRGDALDPWSESLAHAVAFGLAIYVGWQGAGDVPTKVALRLRGFRPLALLGIVPLALGASVLLSEIYNWILQVWPYSIEEARSQARLFAPRTMSERAGILFLFVIVVPAVEEILFRGVLQQRLEVSYGRKLALLFVAAAFAIAHLEPRAFPQYFLAGLALGWISIRTGSVIPAWIAHAVYNAAPLVVTPRLLPVPGYNMIERALRGEPDHVHPGLLVPAALLFGIGIFALSRTQPREAGA